MRLHTCALRRHASRRTRTTTSPYTPACSTIASPSSACRSVSASAACSRSAGTASVATTSANDDRLPCRAAPTFRRVFTHDALLQQHDALYERLGPRRTTRYVDVDRDDRVDTFRDGIRVPVGTAAVRARAHRDD